MIKKEWIMYRIIEFVFFYWQGMVGRHKNAWYLERCPLCLMWTVWPERNNHTFNSIELSTLSLKVHISTESVLCSLLCFAMSPSFEKIPFLLRRFHYTKPILRSVQLMSMWVVAEMDGYCGCHSFFLNASSMVAYCVQQVSSIYLSLS